MLGFDIREPSCDWTGNAFEFCDVRNATRLMELISRFRPERIFFNLAAQSYPTVFLLQPRETVAQCRRYHKPVRVSTRRKSQPRGRNRLLRREYGPVASADLAFHETHPLCPPHPCGVSEVGQDPLVAQYFINYAFPSIRIRIRARSDLTMRDAEIELGMRQASLAVGNLTTRRALIDVHEMVRALWLAPERCEPGEGYNVVGGTQIYSVQELIEIIRNRVSTDFQ